MCCQWGETGKVWIHSHIEGTKNGFNCGKDNSCALSEGREQGRMDARKEGTRERRRKSGAETMLKKKGCGVDEVMGWGATCGGQGCCGLSESRMESRVNDGRERAGNDELSAEGNRAAGKCAGRLVMQQLRVALLREGLN